MVLAQSVGLDVNHAMRKPIFKNLLIDRLVEDEFFEEDYLERKIDVDDGSDSAVKLELDMQKEIELAKLQLQKIEITN